MSLLDHPWLFGLFMFLLGFWLSDFRHARRARRERLAPPGPPPTAEDVDARIREGRLLEAVKAYRHMTNAGLKDAKVAVERRAAQLNVKLR